MRRAQRFWDDLREPSVSVRPPPIEPPVEVVRKYAERFPDLFGNTDVVPSLLRPRDWKTARTRSGDHLHQLFLTRDLFQNFNPQTFHILREGLEAKLREAPTEEVKYQLAVVLVQCMPDRERLLRAQVLLQEVLSEAPDTSETLLPAKSVKHLVDQMLQWPKLREREGHPPRILPVTQANYAVFNRCPLVCRGCYNIFTMQVLPLEEACKIVDKLAEAGVSELIISGGDPMEWDQIFPFLEHVASRGILFAVDTVGYHLTWEKLRRLKELGLVYLGLTWDGHDQETVGQFRLGDVDLLARTQVLLQMADGLDLPVKLNTTVHAGNIEHLPEMAKLLCQSQSSKGAYLHSVVLWSFYQWWPLRSTPQLTSQMEVSSERFHGAVARLQEGYPLLPIVGSPVQSRENSHFFITAEGLVLTFTGSDELPTIILGDLRDSSVEQIEQSPAFHPESSKRKLTIMGIPALPLRD